MPGTRRTPIEPPAPELTGLSGRIRAAIAACEKSYTAIAKDGGLSRTWVTRAASAKRAKPGITADQLLKLARGCGVRCGWLICNEGEMWPSSRSRDSTPAPAEVTEVRRRG